MESKSGSRKYSKNLKERVSIRNEYHIQDAHMAETKAKLNSLVKDLGRNAHFQAISQHLTSTPAFQQVPQDEADPFKRLRKEKGSKDLKKNSVLC